jgi:hypothetical protein
MYFKLRECRTARLRNPKTPNLRALECLLSKVGLLYSVQATLYYLCGTGLKEQSYCYIFACFLSQMVTKQKNPRYLCI